MNENKRLITAALLFFRILKAFFKNYLKADIGTKEKFELDIGALIYSKFLIANYNLEYLFLTEKMLFITSRPVPPKMIICLKQ